MLPALLLMLIGLGPVTGHPALLRMWDKRQSGYRAMGYRMGSETVEE